MAAMLGAQAARRCQTEFSSEGLDGRTYLGARRQLALKSAKGSVEVM